MPTWDHGALHAPRLAVLLSLAGLLSLGGCSADVGGAGPGMVDDPVGEGPSGDGVSDTERDASAFPAAAGRDGGSSSKDGSAAVPGSDAGPSRGRDAGSVGAADAGLGAKDAASGGGAVDVDANDNEPGDEDGGREDPDGDDAGDEDPGDDPNEPDAGGDDPGDDDAGGPMPDPDAGKPLPKLKLWIAGDSTVQTYPASQAPLEGWGQELGPFFSSRVTIDNQALAGRSTRTFMASNVTCVDGHAAYTGGKPDESGTRWQRIRNGLAAGDYLLIQFGHNDAGDVCERHVDLSEYRQNLAKMVAAARARGATPILLTPMSQLSFRNGQFKATLTDYAAAVRETAKSEQVELIDLNTLSVEYYQSKGYQYVLNQVFLVNDTTHFQKSGAMALAELIVGALRDDSSALSVYLE